MNDSTFENMTVEQLAYWFWKQRGEPEGSPEQDWLRAEKARQIKQIERRAAWPTLYAFGVERDTRGAHGHR